MDCLHGMLRYVDKLERNFHLLFTEVGQSAETASIHRLRLNLKKQRALFSLMEHLDPGFRAETAVEAYGKLYPKLGHVRNLQVQREVIRKDEALLHVEPDYSDWLAAREQDQIRELSDYASGFSMQRARRLFSLVKNRLSFMKPETWKPNLNVYFNSRFSLLRTYCLSAPGRDAHFHECRRLVKELVYNLHMVHSLCEETGLPADALKELDSLQEMLGDWHDRYYCICQIREEQGNCPVAIRQQLESEQVVLAHQIEGRLVSLDQEIDEMESAWSRILSVEKVKHAPLRRRRNANGPIRSAFGQVNILQSGK